MPIQKNDWGWRLFCYGYEVMEHSQLEASIQAQLDLIRNRFRVAPYGPYSAQLFYLYRKAKQLPSCALQVQVLLALAEYHAAVGSPMASRKYARQGLTLANSSKGLHGSGELIEALRQFCKPDPPDGRSLDRAVLTELELMLLKTIALQPRGRIDLITAIYGDSVPLQQAENRLKNLLHRIQRKYPGSIVRKGEHYSLDEGCSILEVFRRA